MVYIKKISTLALLTTTMVGGSISFTYGMENNEENRPNTPRVLQDAQENLEEMKGNMVSPNLSESEPSDDEHNLPCLDAEEINQHEAAVKLEMESRRLAEEAAALRAHIAQQQQALVELSLSQQREEIEALKAQREAQTKALEEQEKLAAAQALAQAAEIQRQKELAEEARRQAEAAEAQAAAAHAAFLQQQQEAEALRQQQTPTYELTHLLGPTLTGERSDERIAHNVTKETERALQGVGNLLSGKSWKHKGKKHKKHK